MLAWVGWLSKTERLRRYPGRLGGIHREIKIPLYSTCPFNFRDQPTIMVVRVVPSASGEAVVGEPASLASKRFGFTDSRKAKEAKRECFA